jgi:hypothetical protein
MKRGLKAISPAMQNNSIYVIEEPEGFHCFDGESG